MLLKRLASLSVLLLALVMLGACTQDVHGGGVVTLGDVAVNGNPGQPGSASIGINFTCNDKKDELHGTLAWNDHANRVHFTARLPRTPVGDVFGSFGISTCADAAAVATSLGVSVNMALINSQGQPSGTAIIGVAQPGVDTTCEPTVSGVIIETFDNVNSQTYAAHGCLDRGHLVFN